MPRRGRIDVAPHGIRVQEAIDDAARAAASDTTDASDAVTADVVEDDEDDERDDPGGWAWRAPGRRR